MNDASIVKNSQSAYPGKGHHDATSSGITNKNSDRAQGEAKIGYSVRRSPNVVTSRPTWTMRKRIEQSRLEDDQTEETSLPTVVERTELGKHLEGAGDSNPMSNLWANAAKGILPSKSAQVPSYLQTTESYRLKCVHKPKNDAGEAHRIPFVVGNYTNKSHNVGAKIQETLSLLKGAPRRLQKTEKEKLKFGDLVRCMTAQTASPIARSLGGIARQEITIPIRRRSSASVGSTMAPDYKNHQFRTVLMNLHDEFAKMNSKYEELKNSLKVRHSAEVADQVLNLQEELNAKEVEINAFVDLYNEVNQLKKKLINGPVEVKKNSLNERHSASHLQSEGFGRVFQDRMISTSKDAYRKKLSRFSEHAENKAK